MTKKVFITGATGFLGAYILCELIEKGYQISALRRKSSPMYLVESVADKVEWIEGDILDLPFLEEVMQGVDEVYHAAALVSFDSKDSERMIQLNTDGTANIVNAVMSSGVKKLLHVSSIAALGRKENQSKVDENSQWENNKLNTAYAISKFKSECEVWRGVEEGLSAVIINPSMIMGAGFWHSGTAQMFTQAYKGLSVYPKGATGFVDVRDVARTAVLLTESDIVGERFIVNAENLSYKKMLGDIARALSKSPPRIQLPNWGVELMWRVEKLRARALGIPPLITADLAVGLQSVFEYDNQKIKKALQYEFIPLEKTLYDTAAAFLRSKKENLPAAMM